MNSKTSGDLERQQTQKNSKLFYQTIKGMYGLQQSIFGPLKSKDGKTTVTQPEVCPPRHKINLIKILIHRTLMICSKSKHVELKFIKKTVENLIFNIIKYKYLQFSTKPKFRPEKFSVYLIRLLWISNASMQQIEQIRSSVNCCFNGYIEIHSWI